MSGTRLKIGDIFAVKLDETQKKYFQYVADDLSLLSSYVIRAFKKAYNAGEAPDLREVIKDEVQFYAHVFLKVGLKFGFWEKVGHVPQVGKVNVLFRGTNDFGNPKIKVSEIWYVWKINEPFVRVGKLEGKNRDAEIGVVAAPEDIVNRMRTGKYRFVYPAFE